MAPILYSGAQSPLPPFVAALKIPTAGGMTKSSSAIPISNRMGRPAAMSIVEPLPMGFGGSTSRIVPTQKKPVRPQRRQDYFYPSRDGQPLVKVTRVDRGTGSKFFVQYHWDGHQWVKGLTPAVRAQVPIYRYQEVRRAMAAGQAIWMVEGEKLCRCPVEYWDSGYHDAGRLQKISAAMGIILKTCRRLAWCCAPDRDQMGVAHIGGYCPETFRLLSGRLPLPRESGLAELTEAWGIGCGRLDCQWGLRPIRFGQRWENDES